MANSLRRESHCASLGVGLLCSRLRDLRDVSKLDPQARILRTIRWDYSFQPRAPGVQIPAPPLTCHVTLVRLLDLAGASVLFCFLNCQSANKRVYRVPQTVAFSILFSSQEINLTLTEKTSMCFCFNSLDKPLLSTCCVHITVLSTGAKP